MYSIHVKWISGFSLCSHFILHPEQIYFDALEVSSVGGVCVLLGPSYFQVPSGGLTHILLPQPASYFRSGVFSLRVPVLWVFGRELQEAFPGRFPLGKRSTMKGRFVEFFSKNCPISIAANPQDFLPATRRRAPARHPTTS